MIDRNGIESTLRAAGWRLERGDPDHALELLASGLYLSAACRRKLESGCHFRAVPCNYPVGVELDVRFEPERNAGQKPKSGLFEVLGDLIQLALRASCVSAVVECNYLSPGELEGSLHHESRVYVPITSAIPRDALVDRLKEVSNIWGFYTFISKSEVPQPTAMGSVTKEQLLAYSDQVCMTILGAYDLTALVLWLQEPSESHMD